MLSVACCNHISKALITIAHYVKITGYCSNLDNVFTFGLAQSDQAKCVLRPQACFKPSNRDDNGYKTKERSMTF